MLITLQTTNWTEISDLTDDKTYFLQAKKPIIETVNAEPVKKYSAEHILFALSSATPTDADAGLYSPSYKFTKKSGIKLFVRTTVKDTQVFVQEIQ